MDMKLLEKLDELYTENPTRGARRLSKALKKRFGFEAGRGKVRRLMRVMGVSAIYPKKDLSRSNELHKKYPYLLRGVEITRTNHVWSTDITYIRLKKGFVYLTAVIDWYSRYVLSWRLSTTLDRGFCIEALNEALERYGRPEIFNTDGRQWFTLSGEPVHERRFHRNPEIKRDQDQHGWERPGIGQCFCRAALEDSKTRRSLFERISKCLRMQRRIAYLF